MKIKRATIYLTESLSVQGWEIDDDYRLSASDIGKVVTKGESSVRAWWDSKHAEPLRSMGLSSARVPNPEGGYLSLFPIKVANRYWQHLAKQGDTLASSLLYTLAETDLERRFDQEFDKVKSKEGYVQFSEHAYNEILRTTRDHTIWTHPGFVLANKLNKFPGAQVHDLITVLCGGKTAKLARLDPQPLEGDMHTGLNHYQDAKLLETIARAKLKFTSMKYGSWQNRVTRSCIAALAEMGIQPSVKA